MHEYKTARTIFGFMEFGAWCCVVGGALVFLAGFGGGSQFGGAYGAFIGGLPGILGVIFGLALVMGVQIGRATVDTAQMTSKMLTIATEQLAITRKQATGGTLGPQAFKAPPTPVRAATPAPKPPAQATTEVTPPRPKQTVEQGRVEPEVLSPKLVEHSGKSIRIADDGAYVGMLKFDGLEPAKTFIDQKLIPSERSK